jgi:hypothetical protein
VSVPLLSGTIQMLSLLAVIPASAPAVPSGRMALISFVFTSTRASEGLLPQTGTQILPNPNAKPEHASPGSLIFATILFVVRKCLASSRSYSFALCPSRYSACLGAGCGTVPRSVSNRAIGAVVVQQRTLVLIGRSVRCVRVRLPFHPFPRALKAGRGFLEARSLYQLLGRRIER